MDPNKPSQGIGLSPEQLKAKLSRYVGTLPSTVIDDLYQTLKPMSLPEDKVDEIIERTLKSYSGQESNSRMNELVEKMNNLEDTLIHALKSIESKQARSSTSYESQEQTHTQPSEYVTQKQGTVNEEESFEYDPPPTQKENPAQIFRSESDHNVLLSSVPDSAISNAILLKWVEFLLETVGHQNLPEVLDYYVDIGWISEKVTMKLLAYSSGMVAPRGRAKEKLSTKDHLRSLLFIEKLRGKDFDQSQLTKLEREIKYTIEKRIREG